MNTDAKSSELSSRSKAAKIFMACQAVLIPLVVVSAVWSRSSRPVGRFPAFRATPRIVNPQFDYPRVVSDEQLAEVLTKLRPPAYREKPKINHVDHALRFWGVEATFPGTNSPSGEEMRQLLTDDAAFQTAWGETARPLLIHGDDGTRVRIQEGAASSSHVDHTLATLAEVGTSLKFPIVVRNAESHAADATTGEKMTTESEMMLREVAVSSARRFGLNQREYEWSALALALYSADFRPWVSAEGQVISYDRIARRIMRQDYGQGCCFGGHRLFTLAMLLRLDTDEPFFSDPVRQELRRHLLEATGRFIASQSPEGYWDRDWPGEPIGVDDTVGPQGRRLSATGHALEWWAMSPVEVHPPQETLVRAAQWLVTEIETMDEATVKKNYTFLTHVGRALALWRGDFPAALYQRLVVPPTGEAETKVAL